MTERVKTVTLVIAATLVSLLLAEFAFRVYAIGGAALSYARTRSVVRLGESGLIRPGTGELPFELNPNVNQLFKLAFVRTNSRGLHDREYSIEKPARTFRVAVIGDSQTMASGVDRDEAYHAVLEERLNRESKGRRYEFVNFAVGGYGPRAYLALLKQKVPAYRPDLVLIGFTPGNDANVLPSWRRYRPKPRANGFLQSFLLRSIEVWKAAHMLPPPAPLTAEQTRRLRQTFSNIRERARSLGAPIALVYLARVEDDRRPGVEAISRELGFTFVDTTGVFRGVPLRGTRIFATDHHPNASAHGVIAGHLYQQLGPRFWPELVSPDS